MYSVDIGVPMPDRPASGRPPKYPFGEMEVGDSFSFAEGEAARVGNAAKSYSHRNGGVRFSIRGCRIWRVQ